MSDNRQRNFVVRLGPKYAEIVRDAATRLGCSNNEATEAMIDGVWDGQTATTRALREARDEIERLKTARAVESSDAIDAVQAYAREKGIGENEAAERLIELGWRRHRALEKAKGR